MEDLQMAGAPEFDCCHSLKCLKMGKVSWEKANTFTIFKQKDIKTDNYISVVFNSILQ